MNEQRELCGLFGKLPQQADFVSRHLAEDFTGYWHSWLQACLSVSREQLGEDWLDLYLTSPVWRFAIGAGVCSNQAVLGVMIPSVDEVGRYFPLILAHPGPHRPWAAYLGGAGWYAATEAVALSALEETTGYAALVDAVEALPEPPPPSLPLYKSVAAPTGAARGCAVATPDGGAPEQAVLGLTEKAWRRLLGPHSLWWTRGSEHVEPCLLISAGLPEAGQFAAMFDGDWQRWGWAVEQVVKDEEAAEAPA